MYREDHGCAELRCNAVAVVFPYEEARESCRRHGSRGLLVVEALARGRHSVRVHVGGDGLQLDVMTLVRDLLQEEHGDGVGFLASAAAHDPDPDRSARFGPADQVGYDGPRHLVEHGPIAEESRDVDEEILGQDVEFAGILLQRVQVSSHVVGIDGR